ncbi:MAG: peptidylprolyl isomerase [Chloroflexia bacterium]
MGKKKATLAKPPRRMTKRERSRWQRERRIQRNLLIVLAAVGLIAVGVLIYGIVAEMNVPNQVIARVNGEPILRRDYWAARRMELVNQWWQIQQQYNLYQQLGITLTEQQQQTFAQDTRNALISLTQVRRDPLNETTLQNLIRNTVLLQGAKELGIEPTDEEVDAWLVPDRAAPPPTGTLPLSPTLPTTATTPTPLPTWTPLERSSQVEAQLTAVYSAIRRMAERFAVGELGFSAADYIAMERHQARVDLTRQKVLEHLKAGLPQTEEQVHVSHIWIKDRSARARQVFQNLKSGQSFASLAVQYSDHAATRDRAGDIGWFRRGDGRLPPQVEAAAFALSSTAPFTLTQDGENFRILQLVERRDDEVHLRHIVLPVDRRPEAEALFKTLTPENFEPMARQRSEDADTAPKGGDLGWITPGTGQLSPTVETAALALTTTNPLTLTQDEAGDFHILQLVERRDTQIHLRHILLRNGRTRAEEVLNLLRSRAKDFAQAVVEYSTDQETVKLAGDLGWVTQGRSGLPPGVEAAALALTTTNPITMTQDEEGNFHILRLVERQPAKLHLNYILIKSAKTLAQEIYAYIMQAEDEVERGKRFYEMALRYSDDTASKDKGGDLGWFGRDAYPEIEEQAFSLEPHRFSEVFPGSLGSYHLIWVHEHDMNHPLDAQVLDQRAQQALDEWLQGLLKKAVVERYPPPTPTPVPPTPVPPTPTPEPIFAPLPTTP